MGDPRHQKNKYERPLVRWNTDKIGKERSLINRYGLKRKKEILKAESYLRNIRRRARLIAAQSNEEEREQLLDKCKNLGLISGDGDIDDVLRVQLNDILDRRLQTIVSKKDDVKTPKQARQFIVHGHVKVGDRKMTSPSFLVPKKLDNKIQIKKGLDQE